jgi:hypothetical protein
VSPELIIALFAALLGATSTVWVATLSNRQRRIEKRETTAETIRLIREPLSYAAGDLQSRLWNISVGTVAVSRGMPKRTRTYLELNIAFVFGQYLAWTELLRRRVLLSIDHRGRDAELRRRLDDVQQAMAAPGDSDFLIFPGEQRAIGEIMLTADGDGVIGYAAFARRMSDDDVFASWFSPVRDGARRAVDGTLSSRVVNLQHALVDLILHVDPDGAYTALDRREKIVGKAA